MLCLWLRGGFWTATALSLSIFTLGAAYIHSQDIVVHQNYAPNNAGPILYTDILVPLLTLGLLLACKVVTTEQTRNARRTPAARLNLRGVRMTDPEEASR